MLIIASAIMQDVGPSEWNCGRQTHNHVDVIEEHVVVVDRLQVSENDVRVHRRGTNQVYKRREVQHAEVVCSRNV